MGRAYPSPNRSLSLRLTLQAQEQELGKGTHSDGAGLFDASLPRTRGRVA